jgi:outer membrane protein assembly factor BamA
MRTFLLVVLLVIGATRAAPAQTTADQGLATDRNAATGSDAATPESVQGLAPEPPAVSKVINWFDREINQGGGPHNGFYPELGNMITGSGWISAGPGYRQDLWQGRARINVSAAVSWKVYKMAQARFELPHLANDRLSIGAQTLYQDMLQVNYFGVGNNSLFGNRSGYRLDETDVLGYATVRPGPAWLSMTGRFGWIHQAELSTMTGWNVPYPNTQQIFTDATAPGLAQQPAFFHGDASIAADTRNYAGHPTSGGLYRATFARYTDRTYGKYSFERYDVEANQFLPIIEDNWVIALRGWAVFSQTSGGNQVPFYLMPSLGGKNTLRGYYDFRFHDRDMEVFNVESRWGLFTHLDAAVFYDFGKVGPQLSDLGFSHLKSSYGVGFRVHTRQATVGRVDVGHSVEGWRVILKVNDPFKRSTLSGGRTEVIPFVP